MDSVRRCRAAFTVSGLAGEPRGWTVAGSSAHRSWLSHVAGLHHGRSSVLPTYRRSPAIRVSKPTRCPARWNALAASGLPTLFGYTAQNSSNGSGSRTTEIDDGSSWGLCVADFAAGDGCFSPLAKFATGRFRRWSRKRYRPSVPSSRRCRSRVMTPASSSASRWSRTVFSPWLV